jgi:hypothetical protein
MADEADRAEELTALFLKASIHAATCNPVVPGEPGECERCGDDMPRLVGGLCAPCRDGRNSFGPPAGARQ